MSNQTSSSRDRDSSRATLTHPTTTTHTYTHIHMYATGLRTGPSLDPASALTVATIKHARPYKETE